MFLYLTGFILMYLSCFANIFLKYNGKCFIYIFLIYICILSFFRGNIGTDTATYDSFAEFFLKDSFTPPNIEYVFWKFLHLLSILLNDSILAVRCVSVLIAILLFIAILYSNRDELFILLAFILPAYAFLIFMNALRMGIAFCIFFIGAQLMLRRNTFLNNVLCFSSTLIQSSFIFPALYVNRYFQEKKCPFIFKLFFFFLISIAIFFLVPYFLLKFSVYASFQSPYYYSGISSFVSAIIILVGLKSGSLPTPIKNKIIKNNLIILILIFSMAKFTYAGLRFLDLFLFSILILILNVYRKNNLHLDSNIKKAILLAGIWQGLLVFRGMLADPTFVPYHSWLNIPF